MAPEWCMVRDCRFPQHHTTAGHRCGRCRDFGHGVQECRSDRAMEALLTFSVDELPSQFRCTVPGCRHPRSHTTSGHQCRTCLHYGHGSEYHIQRPSSRSTQVRCPMCRAQEDVTAWKTSFVEASCPVCFITAPMTIGRCGHGVCNECLDRLPQS